MYAFIDKLLTKELGLKVGPRYVCICLCVHMYIKVVLKLDVYSRTGRTSSYVVLCVAVRSTVHCHCSSAAVVTRSVSTASRCQWPASSVSTVGCRGIRLNSPLVTSRKILCSLCICALCDILQNRPSNSMSLML